MCANRVWQGIALLLSSIAAGVVCAVVSVFLIAGIIESAVKKARAAHKQDHIAFLSPSPDQSPSNKTTTLEDLLGPQKYSLRVNVNTAASEELESLPGIGPSKAQAIIDHRPYHSVDDLRSVPGISAKVLERMRAFVKTDGPTEKIASPAPTPP